MTKVFVTGATGFVGSNLVRYLVGRGDYRVSVLVRPAGQGEALKDLDDRIQRTVSDGTFTSIRDALQQTQPDVVVHTAGLTLSAHNAGEIDPLITTNVLLGAHLLEGMISNGIRRFVNTGSFWQAWAESNEREPVNLYAATKNAFEAVMRFYEAAHDLRAVTLRLFGTYGPHDPRQRVFSHFKRSLSAGADPVAFSPGEQVMDLVYIDDVASAYERAIQYVLRKNDSEAETFSIGSGVGISLRGIARIYEECVGRRLNIRWGDLPYRSREMMHSRADIRPAQERLGWRPRYDLKSGIARMLEVESTVMER